MNTILINGIPERAGEISFFVFTTASRLSTCKLWHCTVHQLSTHLVTRSTVSANLCSYIALPLLANVRFALSLTALCVGSLSTCSCTTVTNAQLMCVSLSALDLVFRPVLQIDLSCQWCTYPCPTRLFLGADWFLDVSNTTVSLLFDKVTRL